MLVHTCVPPTRAHVEALTCNAAVFASGAFGLGEVTKVGPPGGIGAPVRRGTRELAESVSLSRLT